MQMINVNRGNLIGFTHYFSNNQLLFQETFGVRYSRKAATEAYKAAMEARKQLPQVFRHHKMTTDGEYRVWL